MYRSVFLIAFGAVGTLSGTLVTASTIEHVDPSVPTTNKYILADISSDLLNGLKGAVMDQVRQQPQSDKTQQTNNEQVPTKSNASNTEGQNNNAEVPTKSNASKTEGQRKKQKSATSTRKCHRGNRYCGTY